MEREERARRERQSDVGNERGNEGREEKIEEEYLGRGIKRE